MAKKEFLLTSEGFLDLETELNELKNVRRPKVIEAIKDARSQGDLSENADYDAARAEQAEVEEQIQNNVEQKDNAAKQIAENNAQILSLREEIAKAEDLQTLENVRGSTAGTKDKQPGNSGSRWYQVYKSEEFIVDAFRFANAYAPSDVKLCYNDYNEYMGNHL